MTVFTQSLADLFKQLLQSLQLPYLFPAAIFTFVTSFLFGVNTLLDPFNHIVFLFGVTTVLSYLLFALNVPIIRMMEGYTCPGLLPFRWAHDHELRNYGDLVDRLSKLNKKHNELKTFRSTLDLFGMLDRALNKKLTILEKQITDQIRPLEERWQLRYPPLPRKPLPTALGNTIAAFEAYSWTRYRIDAVYMWPRLIPILVQKKFVAFVQQEKSIMDFLLNTSLILLAVCGEFLVVFAFSDHNRAYLALSLSSLVLAYILYRAGVVAAEHWGDMVRVAFDLYRNDLRKALYLPELPSNNLKAEREFWHAVSNFIVFGNEYNFPGFLYPKDVSPSVKEEKE